MHFVDLHVHLLPGIDDGPASLEETVRLLHLAHRQGTRTLVATPHMFLPPWDLREPEVVRRAFAETVAALESRGQRPGMEFLHDLSLHLGAENNLSPGFLEALAARRVVSINHGLYLLIEISPYFPSSMLDSAIERILRAGFVPVLAHVDRYPELLRHPGRLGELVAMGLVVQINASSLQPRGRRAITRAAVSLLERGLAHVIASDAHGSERRPPDQGLAAEVLRRRFSEQQISAWMFENPSRILNNQSISTPGTPP